LLSEIGRKKETKKEFELAIKLFKEQGKKAELKKTEELLKKLEKK